MNRRQFFKATAGVGAVAAGLAVDGAWAEPHDFEGTTFPIHPSVPDLDSETLRFAFMSDFHRSPATSRQLIREPPPCARRRSPTSSCWAAATSRRGPG